MKLTVNGFEIEVQEDGAEGFTFRVRKEGGAFVTSVGTEDEPKKNNFYKDKSDTKLPGDLRRIIDVLGITEMTMVMISNKVLGFPTTGDDLPKQFPDITARIMDYLERDFKEDVWAILVSPIRLPGAGQVVAAVGINSENQLTILGYAETAPKLYLDIIKRGINPKKVKIGILSSDLDDKKAFSKSFPAAEIGEDWHQFRDRTSGMANKELISEAMKVNKKSEAQKLLKKLNPSDELFTHFDFDGKLWRALRSTSPVQRIESDLKQRVKLDALEESQVEMALAWGLVRLQYQWQRIPVDSPQLQGLKYT